MFILLMDDEAFVEPAAMIRMILGEN